MQIAAEESDERDAMLGIVNGQCTTTNEELRCMECVRLWWWWERKRRKISRGSRGRKGRGEDQAPRRAE